MSKALPKKEPGRMALLKAAMEAEAAASQTVAQTIAEHFPVGGFASWDKHGHLQSGVVVDLDGGHNLKVRNSETGREYWIDCGWLQDPFE